MAFNVGSLISYVSMYVSCRVRKKFVLLGVSAATFLGILIAIVVVLVTRTSALECGPKFISSSKLGYYKKVMRQVTN